MPFLQFLKKKNLNIQNLEQVTGRKINFIADSFLHNLFDKTALIDCKTLKGQYSAFLNCPSLNAIITRRIKAHNNAKIWLLDNNGKEVKNELQKNLQKLLIKPNPLQNWHSLQSQAFLYYYLFGECYIFAVKPSGFKNAKDITTLWVIPNWLITKNFTKKYLFQNTETEIVENYTLTLNNNEYTIPLEDILNIKDIYFDYANPYKSTSRLYSLTYPVNNIITAYNVISTLNKKRGALGFISNENKDQLGQIPLTKQDKENLQAEFQNYGITDDKWQVIITNAALKWNSITFPIKDLMLFEGIEESTRAIADIYEYPMFLLGFKSGTTFNNVSEAKKSLYTDSIIPDTELFFAALSNFFKTESYGFKILPFFDHLDIFQQSVKDKYEAIKLINEAYNIAYEKRIITLEEWRLALDLDPEKFNGGTFY